MGKEKARAGARAMLAPDPQKAELDPFLGIVELVTGASMARAPARAFSLPMLPVDQGQHGISLQPAFRAQPLLKDRELPFDESSRRSQP